MSELLIILGITVGLVFWFRRQQQRELAKFMNDDMSAIQTLNKTLESSGRKPIDVPAMPLDSADEVTRQRYATPSLIRSPEPTVPVIYERRPAILDSPRRDLLITIERTLKPGYRVFAELRLSELVQAKPGAIDDLLSRQLSFCVCTADAMVLVAGIQLYLPPESHLGELDRLFTQLQLPLIKVSILDPARIERVRQALVALNLKSPAETIGRPSRVIEKLAPKCPLCQGQMHQRRVTRGAMAKAQVWVCKTYPSCKGMMQ